MKYCKGLLTAFSLRFTPHIQCKTRTDLRVRPHAVDTLLPLAIAPVAPFHGIGCRRQSRVVKKGQRFLQRRGKELLEGVAQHREPLHVPPQGGELSERGLGPAPSITQRVDLLHARTQLLQLGHPPGDPPEGLAVGCAQVPLDEQRPMGAQCRALRGQPLFGAGGLRGRWRARAPSTPFGWGGCQALAGAGNGTSDGFAHLGHDMKRTDVMRDIPAHLCAGRGRER